MQNFFLAFLLLLSACAGTVDTRGNLPNQEQLSLVKPGEVSREDVSAMLGSPSSTSNFDDEAWYYISEKVKSLAFMEPKVLERNVIAVKFDKKGMVKDVVYYDLSDSRKIKPVDRVTPTTGSEMTFLEQMFGNLGRFSGAGSGAGGGK